MSSPPKFILTSSPSQASKLRDSRVLNNPSVGFDRDWLPAKPTQQNEEARAQEVAIEEQKRAKQICDADRERFRQFYNDELQRKRPEQFLYRERPRGGPNKTFQAGEGDIESNKAAQEKLRARQEQRVKDDQLRDSWEAFNGTGIRWLAHNDPDDLYDDEELGPLGIILLGQLGQFTTLKSAENNFNKDKPEFSLQLQVEERSLETLKVLVRRRDRNLTVTNPLRVKVAESDITSPSFTPGDPFPAAFDGATTDDDQDGDDIDASRFTAGDKVAVQAWFGSYVFTNKSGKTISGPTFRLLKLWRLQAGVSGSSSLNSSPVTKRRRIL